MGIMGRNEKEKQNFGCIAFCDIFTLKHVKGAHRNERNHCFVCRTAKALLLYESEYQTFTDATQENSLHAAQHCILCIAFEHCFCKQHISFAFPPLCVPMHVRTRSFAFLLEYAIAYFC